MNAAAWRDVYTKAHGSVESTEELLLHVSERGLEPELRAAVWPLLLGAFALEDSYEARAAVLQQHKEHLAGLLKTVEVRLLCDPLAC